MEKINWLDKVTNDEVLRRVIMANNELYLAKETSMACFEFFYMTDFCMKLLKAE